MDPSRTEPPRGSGPRPEVELLQLTARVTMGCGQQDKLRDLLSGSLDWAYVLDTGARHGVLPLMNAHLRGREEVPGTVRLAIRERTERVTRSNLYLSVQLLEIFETLQRAGIEALVIKGPAVAATLYGSLSLREYGDLDLLVRSDDVRRATEVLESVGFVAWLVAGEAQRRAMEEFEYSRTFTRPADDLDLDLHWDLARSFFSGRVEAPYLWSSRSSFDLHGRKLPCLSPRALLPTLCVHGAKHGPFPWPRMKWVCDVAEYVRTYPGLDWREVLEDAEVLGCRRTMLLGLTLARPLIDGALPLPIEKAIGDEPLISSLSGRIWSWLASPEPVRLSFKDRVGIDLTLIDDTTGRVRYALGRLLSPTQKDWKNMRLPGRMSFLYRPLRVLRLMRQYALTPWRLRRLLGQRERLPSSDESEAGRR